MYSPAIVAEAVLNGLMTGAVYALIALGLTLVYGVLHIINFAHGALLTVCMYAVWALVTAFGLNPYVALIPMVPAAFVAGYLLQRLVIGTASRGDDNAILLVTLGLSIVLENALLALFRSDPRSIPGDAAFEVLELGPLLLSQAKLVGMGVAVAVAVILWLVLTHTDIGRAIRAVAKERLGASLVGINVAQVYAVTFGIGLACLAVTACLLMPQLTVQPQFGRAYVLVAFTIVVLGGMGSIPGALLGGLLIGAIEALCGLFLGESLGQIGIFVLFILVLLLRPQGLFGARA
ncbi:branched-chain amino acid ABC transporter permease [Roseomonas sp. CCTCC AB2023176]|uniref:branched-chain amino acid ABC transporter permease n=1 Tax=Roseomonas sp. CCTCC AB2023176 TaxID=3342640 RepID=UPI0035E2C301